MFDVYRSAWGAQQQSHSVPNCQQQNHAAGCKILSLGAPVRHRLISRRNTNALHAEMVKQLIDGAAEDKR